MMPLYKFRSKYFSYGILTAVIIYSQTWITAANGVPHPHFGTALTITADTTKPPVKKNTPATAPAIPDSSKLITADSGLISGADTTPVKGADTGFVQKTDTFNLKLSKDSLEAPLKYTAEDSVVVMIKSKKIYLYGKTKTEYTDITLTAPKVEMDQNTQVVTAYNEKDSTGKILENAKFKQGENEFSSDTIRYNFKTQVGLTRNTIIPQGEIIILGNTIKKVNENTSFIKGARFTTCMLDDPHFAFTTPKMKVINQKLAISGPAHPEFEGVPVPIYLPFGFYPLSQGRHSGMLRPNFITDEIRGIGMQHLGYYKVLNDYWDAEVSGDIFSYGEWAAGLKMTYRKIYKYSGGFNLTFRSSKQNFKGDPDFSRSRIFNVTWNHSMDSRARPGVSFSANVNAGSTKYNRLVPGNAFLNYQNIMGSSITFNKSWKNKPYNLSVSATHSQNNNLGTVNLSLPNMAFTVSTLYPLENKNRAGTAKWYEKLGIAYNGSFSNSISFNDTIKYGQNGIKPFFKYLLDTAQWSAQHNIPITLALPPILGGKVLVSPGISYSQTWIQRTTNYQWNSALKKVDTITAKGIYIDQRSSVSLSFNTAVFGTVQFKKSRVIALRHTVRPQVGFSYTPDLNTSHIKSTQVDTTGKVLYYNEIGGTVLYNTSSRRSGAMSFGVDNNIEMKVRSKKDTGDAAIKRVKVIEGFGFSGSYDFIRDSFKLSPISFYFRTTLFEKLNINASTTLNPYQTDSRGYDIKKYAWEGGRFKLGRLTSGSISMSTNFQSKPKDAKKDEARKKAVQERLQDPGLLGDQQRLLEYMQQNPNEFVDFNIDWNLGLSYSLSFVNRIKADFSGYETDFQLGGISFNGGFNLTPKWKLTGSGSYDLETMKLQYITMSINRDMHCWQLAINVIPVGYTRSFNFTISPKSTLLQDLKVNRTRYFY
jgi:lipopolysaccharide assembly outer membrane protein LptD (OstA)